MTIGSIDTRIEFNDKLAMIGINLGFVYNISSAVVNSVITLLTAGRIWWIHRQVRAHGIHTSDGPVSRIILESGMIFPMLSIAALCTANTAASVVVDLSPITYSSAVISYIVDHEYQTDQYDAQGFAPTLIMVRAKLGKNVESLQDHVSDIRFTSQPIPRDETRHSIRSLGVAVVEVEGVREQPEQMADGNLKEGNVV
ncbi:hypothetical protein MPER_10040 [Moniliophthora perniciosa FA553]|nr:hypothetical protein MPER_10040 [Moniliophthora perniciosa FA553]